MVRSITQTLEDNLKNKVNVLEKEIWIDWNNDGIKDANEIITNDVLNISVDKQKQGDFGISVVDRATIDVDNSNQNYSPKNINDGKWSGNVVPARDVEISLGVDDEKINIFNGLIKDINPQFNDYTSDLTVDDKILLLQEEDCPDKFYYDERPEDIIKEWLESVGITNYNLDSTKYIINYNFDGMKMWQAIQMINEATQAATYMQDDVFIYETRLSLDYDTENDSVHTFTHQQSSNENVWEITEELGTTNMYNKVTLESDPFKRLSKRIIWTGAEEQSEVIENYQGSDVASNELQLGNYPLIEGSISVLDLTDETQGEYLEGSGIDTNATDYDNGIIVFENTTEYPIPPDSHALRVSYEYYFNQIPVGETKDFTIELDEPAINIENLIVYAKEVNSSNELNVSFTDDTADIYVTQSVYDNLQEIDVTITNNSGVKAVLYGKEHGKEIPNFLLKGEPFAQTNKMKITRQDQDSIDSFEITNSYSINNNLIQSHQHLKEMSQYFIWRYSTPLSRLEVKATPALQLQLGDIVTVVQNERDIDNDFEVVGIRHEINEEHEWDVYYTLVQAYPSDWTYTDDGTPVLDGGKNIPVYQDGEPSALDSINTELITAELNKNYKVRVSWSQYTNEDFGKYNVYQRKSTESDFRLLRSIEDKSTLELIDSSVEYGKRYYYKVAPVDQYGNETSLIDITPSEILVEDKASTFLPSFIDAECYFSNGEVFLKWDEIEGTEKYELRSDTNFGDSNYLYQGTGNSFTITINQDIFPDSSTATYYLDLIDREGNYTGNYDDIPLSNDVPSDPTNLQVIAKTSNFHISISPDSIPRDIDNIQFEVADNSSYTSAETYTASTSFIAVPIVIDGTNYIRVRFENIFGQTSNWITTSEEGSLITKEDLQGDLFQITPSSDPSKTYSELEQLWDMDTTSGISYTSAPTITFEYPSEWLFDMARFYVGQSGITYDITIDGVSVASGSTNSGWNIVEFDQMYNTDIVVINFGSAIDIYELKFWTITLADEILAQTLTLTGSMSIQNSDGSVFMNSNEIKAVDAEGDYSILDSDHLAFYKSGSSTPHWYSKMVAYGTAQDGDYIDLSTETGTTWEHSPKVQTAIKSLISYHSSYSGNTQTYESYADAVTPDGFYVYGKSIIEGAEQIYTINTEVDAQTSWTSGDSRSGTTKLRVDVHIEPYLDDDYDIDWSIYYKKSSAGSWTFYNDGSYYDPSDPNNHYYSYTISGLAEDTWQVKVKYEDNGTNSGDLFVDEWADYSDTIVDNGDVMWIAVEGGAN